MLLLPVSSRWERGSASDLKCECGGRREQAVENLRFPAHVNVRGGSSNSTTPAPIFTADSARANATPLPLSAGQVRAAVIPARKNRVERREGRRPR